MSVSYDQYPDRIAQTFDGKTILITGATGFIGKVLLEKILRSCPEFRKIYLLIRTKREKEAHLRLKEIFKTPLFDFLKSKGNLEIFSKVEGISGDIELPDLGLSLADLQKIGAEVEIIYHCAACVRFDIPLKQSVIVNVRGTKLMLDLAKRCEKLLNFTFISTAYCHLNEEIVCEEMYPAIMDPYRVLRICEDLDSDMVEKIKKDFLGDFPNCYPFTKSLCEGLVSAEMDNLPVVIFRPSVVVPIWKEPLPGYTDNIHGPTGILIGAGKGVIRTLYSKSEGCLDYIPADIVVNGLLFSTFDYLTYKGVRKVYNAVASKQYQVTFRDIVKLGKYLTTRTLPFNNILWYPGGSVTQSKIRHYTSLVLFQILPAAAIDSLLIMLRKKPFLIKIQKRTMHMYEIFEYYINRNWEFDNTNTLKAIKNLNPRERQIYKLDGDDGNFRDYFLDCIRSARLYLLNETDDQIPTAKLQMKTMWYVDKLCKIIFFSAILYYICLMLFL